MPDKESFKVSIRTSQDAWFAFPRTSDGKGWVTLDDVDYVIAVSVDDRHNPTKARVHMIPATDARERFNRARDARIKAGHTLPNGRGIWLSLYDKESNDPVSHVGAGMGLDYNPLATLDLRSGSLPTGAAGVDGEPEGALDDEPGLVIAKAPLTIAEAKRRLSETLGVPEGSIRITIEH